MRLPKFGLYRILEQAGFAAAGIPGDGEEKLSPPARRQLAGN